MSLNIGILLFFLFRQSYTLSKIFLKLFIIKDKLYSLILNVFYIMFTKLKLILICLLLSLS